MPRINDIHTSVFAAFFDSGRRKAGTPFEIASTPVSATAPEEKPLRIRKMPRVPPNRSVPSNASRSKGTGAMSSAMKLRYRPYTTSAVSVTM